MQAAASSIGKPAARVAAAAAGRAEQEVLLTLRLLHLEAVGGLHANSSYSLSRCSLRLAHQAYTQCYQLPDTLSRFHSFPGHSAPSGASGCVLATTVAAATSRCQQLPAGNTCIVNTSLPTCE